MARPFASDCFHCRKKQLQLPDLEKMVNRRGNDDDDEYDDNKMMMMMMLMMMIDRDGVRC